jgi:uncharacterized membrane protein YhiD involved in acid resistance
LDELIRSLSMRPQALTAAEVILNLLVAFVLGIFISWVYRQTHRQMTVSFSFVNTLVLLSMIMTMVIMVIGNNIARAFGLAGAMSIIRFRTVVKDTRDTAFVFYALGAGMASGTGNLVLAVLGTLLIGLFTGVLHWTRHGATGRNAYVLSFDMEHAQGSEAPRVYSEVFGRYFSSYGLISAKSSRLGEYVNHTFQVYLKPQHEITALVGDLSNLEGIRRVLVSFGEDGEN